MDNSKAIVIDTADGIAFAQLAALRGAVRLEVVGLTRRGRSAVSIAKERYGLKGNKQSILDQLSKMIEDIHASREAVAVV